ncbi:unnamed protein product [Caenorhabditis angaria]|uniref:Secreted protein n=1 Tax=Caenorhabditis angaria TaxID=860376 RepID=A0A9P1IIU4_9PELO|nr:unnamed protein product [Caenorhabditis angaria]
MRGTLFFLIFIILQVHVTSKPVVITGNDKQTINLMVWICPDATLFAMIQSALQQYRTVDDINKSVQDQVTGYKNAIWLVNTINYSRTTANTDPIPNTSSKNLCFIQAPSEQLIVFIAAVVA